MDESPAEKIFVVTGATSGIGLAVAQMLVERGASVIGVGRSPERCREAATMLARGAAPSARIAFVASDLSLQAHVRAAAAQIGQFLDSWSHPHLDGLVNNAATVPFWQTLTAEGFDMQWAVNHLAPFLLTSELLPRLSQSPRARVVTVSSGSHRGGRLDWSDLQLFRHYAPLRSYSATKLANVLFTVELNRRLGTSSNVRAFAADPGLVNTSIGAKSNSAIARFVWNMRRRGGVPPSRSAAGIVFLLSEPSIHSARDIYWKDCRPIQPSLLATNEQAARQLWEVSAQMCGISV